MIGTLLSALCTLY